MDKEQKHAIISEYARSGNDVGSVDVQVAVLSGRIRELTEHLKVHKKDNHSRRGLIALVNRRRKLLNYLKGESSSRHRELVQRLGLRIR